MAEQAGLEPAIPQRGHLLSKRAGYQLPTLFHVRFLPILHTGGPGTIRASFSDRLGRLFSVGIRHSTDQVSLAMAIPAGLEPATPWLTARCSAN